MARTTSLTWGQYTRFLKEWAQGYIKGHSYWTIESRPVCAINNLADFVTKYGHATFAVMVRYARRVMQKELGVDPYILGVIGEANPRNVRLTNSLQVDAITGYGLLPNWLGNPIQKYEDLISERVRDWESIQRRIRVPFYPVVCSGWDATVRGAFRGELRAEDGYPHSPIVTSATPALFGYFIDRAIAFNLRWQPRHNIVFLHAWNEWSESSVIEPSDRFGSALLDEVKQRALGISPMVSPGLRAAFAEENAGDCYGFGRRTSLIE